MCDTCPNDRARWAALAALAGLLCGVPAVEILPGGALLVGHSGGMHLTYTPVSAHLPPGV